MMSGVFASSHSGAGPPFRTDLDSSRLEAPQDTSLTIMHAGHAPPRLSQRLPDPHRSILGSIDLRRKSMAWLRHIAEMFPRSGVMPFR